MKSLSFLLLITLFFVSPSLARYTGDFFDDWKEKCYNDQCIKLNEEKLIIKKA